MEMAEKCVDNHRVKNKIPMTMTQITYSCIYNKSIILSRCQASTSASYVTDGASCKNIAISKFGVHAERFHLHYKQPYCFAKTADDVCTKIVFISHRIELGH